MRSKRWLLLGIALAGALALFSATQPWAVISFAEGAAAFGALELPGHELNPAFSPVAIAALAAALALTIAGRVFRWVLGVLVALLGASIAAIGFGALGDPIASAASRIAEVTGISGEGQRAIVDSLEVTAWPSAAIGVGVLLVVLGALVLLMGGKWKHSGRRYGSGEDRAAARVRAAEEGDPDRIADWDAQNSGDDPTEP